MDSENPYLWPFCLTFFVGSHPSALLEWHIMMCSYSKVLRSLSKFNIFEMKLWDKSQWECWLLDWQSRRKANDITNKLGCYIISLVIMLLLKVVYTDIVNYLIFSWNDLSLLLLLYLLHWSNPILFSSQKKIKKSCHEVPTRLKSNLIPISLLSLPHYK